MKYRKRRKANYELRKCIDIEHTASKPGSHEGIASESIAEMTLSRYFGSFFYAEVCRDSESCWICFYRCNWQTLIAKSITVPLVHWFLASLYSIFSVNSQYDRIMNLCIWEITIIVTLLELAFFKYLWLNENIFYEGFIANEINLNRL